MFDQGPRGIPSPGVGQASSLIASGYGVLGEHLSSYGIAHEAGERSGVAL